MPDQTFLRWPFFEERHRALARELDEWARRELRSSGPRKRIAAWSAYKDGKEIPARPRQDKTAEAPSAPHPQAGLGHEAGDVDHGARERVARLAAGGWLRHCVPAAHGGASEKLDARTLCLIRETLARHDALADVAFGLQCLGSVPISLFGDEGLRKRYLADVATGKRIAAFALSEPEAGSDVAAISTRARPDGDGFVLDGTKTWVTNAGIADVYVVFARTSDDGARGLSAFVVDADARGLEVSGRIDVIAPHPLGTLRFDSCRVGRDRMLGAAGRGYAIAMASLDWTRPTVGAAALGFARRALDAAAAHVRSRIAFGKPLAEQQLVQEKLATMALDIDASALLVYRAAWTKDMGAERITREAAMAKLFATEAAQRVVDAAVQLFGGLGVVSGSAPEELYREVRAMRIYEGASEIQQLIIAGQVLASYGEARRAPPDEPSGPLPRSGAPTSGPLPRSGAPAPGPTRAGQPQAAPRRGDREERT